MGNAPEPIAGQHDRRLDCRYPRDRERRGQPVGRERLVGAQLPDCAFVLLAEVLDQVCPGLASQVRGPVLESEPTIPPVAAFSGPIPGVGELLSGGGRGRLCLGQLLDRLVDCPARRLGVEVGLSARLEPSPGGGDAFAEPLYVRVRRGQFLPPGGEIDPVDRQIFELGPDRREFLVDRRRAAPAPSGPRQCRPDPNPCLQSDTTNVLVSRTGFGTLEPHPTVGDRLRAPDRPCEHARFDGPIDGNRAPLADRLADATPDAHRSVVLSVLGAGWSVPAANWAYGIAGVSRRS